MTTDGRKPYLEVVESALHGDIDYAMLVKPYGPGGNTGQRRYSTSKFVNAEPHKINENPDINKVSTSYVERANLTISMSMRRLTRLTNGFSKKVEHLQHAVSLHFMHYNFARIHETLRVIADYGIGHQRSRLEPKRNCSAST